MKALIDPRENRVCQVEQEEFEVAGVIFWVDCDSSVTPDTHMWQEGVGVVPKPSTVDPWETVVQTLHDSFPSANTEDINWLLSQEYKDMELKVVKRSDGRVIGVANHMREWVTDLTVAYLAYAHMLNDLRRLGVPVFTEPYPVIGGDRPRLETFLTNQGLQFIEFGTDRRFYLPYDLSMAKARKSRQIERDRDATISAGFSWNGKRWDSDTKSRENLVGAVAAVNSGVPLPSGFTWRSEDNVNVAMNDQDLIALGSALLAHVNAAYQTSWNRKATVSSATTEAEVDAA